MNVFFFAFLLTLPFVGCYTNFTSHNQCKMTPLIELKPSNILLLKGEVNEVSVQKFLYDLHKHDRKKELILFLDTNGGSVAHGNKIVNEVQKYNIACVAERAYSMGFVILQACKKRYITPYGRIMQHQLSYGIGNENNESGAGDLYVFNPSDTTFVTHFYGEGLAHTDDDKTRRHFISGYVNATAAVDEIQFKMTEGTIDTGTIKMYGIA